MFTRKKLTGAVLSVAMIATIGISTNAQEATTKENAAPQEHSRGMRRGERRHQGRHFMQFMRDLNLTQAQKEQAREIVKRFRTNIQPQREALMEMRKQREQGAPSEEVKAKAQALRGEIKTSLKNTHGELLRVLTPEQRAQFDQMELKMKARREERRARRGERKMEQPEKAPAQ